MPMSLDQWLTQARERHAVLSSMDSDQMEIALEEAQRENLPMLMAQREFLDNMLAMLDPKRGGSESKGKKFAASIVKKAHKIEQEAKKVSRQP